MKHGAKAGAHGARFWLVLLSLVAILSVVALSCGGTTTRRKRPVRRHTPAAKTPSGGTTPAAKGQLKIGILFDFTGDLAEFGPNMMNGAKLAAKDINDAGGVIGQDIVLKQADSQTSPTAAVDAARQLVESDKVSAVIGSLSSGVTLAVAEAVTVPEQDHPDIPGLYVAGLDGGGGQRLPLPNHSVRRRPGAHPRQAGEGARLQQGRDDVRQQCLRAGPLRELREVLRG